MIGEKSYNVFSAEYNRGRKTNYYFFSKDHKNLPVSIMVKKDGKEKMSGIFLRKALEKKAPM